MHLVLHPQLILCALRSVKVYREYGYTDGVAEFPTTDFGNGQTSTPRGSDCGWRSQGKAVTQPFNGQITEQLPSDVRQLEL